MSNADNNSGSRSGSTSGATWRSPGGIEVKPHAYDPYTHPELFRGVLPRRMIAFLIDIVILAIPVLVVTVLMTIFGLITLGLGFVLFALWMPAVVIWGLIYYGTCLGSVHSATIGMRLMDLQMRTWYGEPCYFVLGAIHVVLFYVSISCLTPFVLLVGLFNSRHRLVHDMVAGTVVINTFRNAPPRT